MSSFYEAQSLAAELDRHLGDPALPNSRIPFARSVELDEAEEFPVASCEAVHDWGADSYFVPSEFGGNLRSFEEAIALTRVVSSRDLTVAIALGQTYLGAVHVWIAGSDAQKRRAAELIESRKLMSFALTERDHGGDILANELEAVPSDGGYRLTGEKWLINNGNRADALTIFARTQTAGGARGFSLFLFDKELASSGWSALEKIYTLGVRGADISGVRFKGTLLPVDSLIGAEGSGLEIALKGLMLTRTLCAGFSLGAADSALRIALDFVTQRRLYGGPTIGMPLVKRTLSTVLCDIAMCEVLAYSSARGLHFAPEQFSVRSAIVKYFVPVTLEAAIRELAVILGARYYLRQDLHHGAFQKIVRDAALVSLFDGSTAVNLTAICLQLPRLLGQFGSALQNGNSKPCTKAFTFAESVPEFDAARLSILSRGKDDVLQSLPHAVEALEGAGLDCETPIREYLSACGRTLLSRAAALQVHGQPRSGAQSTPEHFDVARDYCILHAASACINVWLLNRSTADPFFFRGQWLCCCLHRLLERLHSSVEPLPDGYVDAMLERLKEMRISGETFSLFPLRRVSEPRGTPQVSTACQHRPEHPGVAQDS